MKNYSYLIDFWRKKSLDQIIFQGELVRFI